jgi:molybdopterin-guanine dinucleotide biosynthesis protein A
LINLSDVAAIVLAGGSGDALTQAFRVSNKALVPIQGKPMAYYVLRALKQSQLGFISYVGEADAFFVSLIDAVVPAGLTMADSLRVGAEAAQKSKCTHLLILSADVPWLHPKAVTDFIGQAPPADLIYPVIPRDVSEAQFPGQKRTYVRVIEGAFTGGNLVLVSLAALPKLIRVLNQLHDARKNPLKLASLFGFDMVFKLLLRRLCIPELEARASKILNLSARGFIATDASLGADIDKLEHLQSIHVQNIGK